MVTIYRPEEPKVGGTTRLDSYTPNNGAIYNQMSQVEASLGKFIQDQAQEAFNKNDANFKDIQYNTATIKAREEFSAAYMKKMEEIKAAKGNVDLKTLPAEIKKLSEDINAKYAGSILDQGVRTAAERDFNHFTINKGLEAVATATRLQEQEAAKLDAEAIDMAELDGDLAALNSAVNRSIAAGRMMPSEGRKVIERVTKKLEIEQQKADIREFSDSIQDDPVLASKFADMKYSEAESLGIDLDTFDKMRKIASVQNKANIEKASREEQDKERLISENQKAVYADLGIRILERKATEADLYTAEAIGSINKQQLKSLLKQKKSEDSKENKFNKLTDALNAGDNVSIDFTDEDISNHFKKRVKDKEASIEAPLNLEEKAKMADEYNSPVNYLKDDIVYNFKDGDSEQALRAYDLLTVKKSKALDKMSKEDRAALSLASTLAVEHGIPVSRAIEISKENVYNKDTARVKTLEDRFTDIEEFKDKNIDSTIRNMFGLINSPVDKGIETLKEVSPALGGLADYTPRILRVSTPFGLGDKAIQPETISKFKSALKEFYVATNGDLPSAIKAFKDSVSTTYGVTEFNESKGYIDDTEQFMYMPPEMAYPRATSSELKADFIEYLDGKLPEGVTADQVKIGSDRLTAAAGPNGASYNLYYIDNKGLVQVLKNKNNQPLRWRPNYESIVTSSRAKVIEEANIEALENTAKRKALSKTNLVSDYRFNADRVKDILEGENE